MGRGFNGWGSMVIALSALSAKRYRMKPVDPPNRCPMPNDLTRLTISWTKDTDLAVRSYLGDRGMKKGDLSRFIEDAVRWRLFDQTVEAIKDRNADTDPDEPMDLIDSTVREVRCERARRLVSLFPEMLDHGACGNKR